VILLTGASGFLGRTIFEHLSSNYNEIYRLGRNDSNEIRCDLSTEIPLFSDREINLVIHSAGKAHFIPKTISQKQEFFDINVNGTKNLLKGLDQSAKLPDSFIFISSVAVYGLVCGNNISENAPLLATDPYGLSKIKAEKLILEWCKNNNVVCTILRLPLLVGANPPGNLGSMIKGIKGGYYFNISGGTAKKSMVMVSDVARIIIRVSTIGGIYNLTDGYHPSFAELSSSIAKQIGKRTPSNLPLLLAKNMAKVGDLFANNAPINSCKLKKIISDLTFDDAKAISSFGWDANPVLKFLEID
jgi:nucleoside-diphosphate-sugar epimerase